MKVLLIYIDCNSSLFPPHYSAGIGSLVAMLKRHDHSPKLVYYKGREKDSEVLQTIEEWHPDIIGFSSVSVAFPNVKRIAALIKEQYSESFIICGGIHPTIVPECLEETPHLDAICRGEAEYPLIFLLESLQQGRDITATPSFWFRRGNTIIKNPLFPVVENLDELPIPDRDIFDYESVIQHYRGRGGEFLFCRGCPFDCTYCTNTSLKKVYPGKYVRYPSVQRTIDELVQVTTRYHLESVALHDDTLTLNKKWFYAFCEEYEQKVALPFICQTRVGTIDRDMMRALKKAGCFRVIMGIESGNGYIRKHVLNRNMTNEQILETFRCAHEEGLETHSQNMVGLPEETPKRFVDTIRLVAATEVGNWRSEPAWEPHVWIFHPYPGTKLYETCEKQGLMANVPLPEDFKERADTILRLPGFQREDIIHYKQNFALFVKREQKALEQKICLEQLLPPYPQFFRFIAWHESLKSLFRSTITPPIIQQLRLIRIRGLGVLKRWCGETIYSKLKTKFHLLISQKKP